MVTDLESTPQRTYIGPIKKIGLTKLDISLLSR